jgi:hypothetical protein
MVLPVPFVDQLNVNKSINQSSECFAWQQAAQCPPIFQFVMRWGSCMFVHCTGVNIRFLLTIFKEGLGNVFL